MTSGIERRAEIDTETTKALLLLHGGAAVTLLAFLPAVLGKPQYEALFRGILCGITAFLVGLLATVLHSRLRRVCSLEFEKHEFAPPPCDKLPLKYLNFENDPPCVCRMSVLMLWVSVIAFAVGGGLVVYGGFRIL